MKTIAKLLALGWLVWPAMATALTRQVTNLGDELYAEGTLRTILQAACDHPEDDEIRFDYPNVQVVNIALKEPLAIPQDCQGKIWLHGKENSKTLLRPEGTWAASQTPGDACMLNIYSNNNTIEGISFDSYFEGAALCIFGRANQARGNSFGEKDSQAVTQNRYGVIVSDAFSQESPGMDGASNEITDNSFALGHQNAIWVQASDLTVSGNLIEGSTQHGMVIKADHSRFFANTIRECGGSGMLISSGSSSLLIGGVSFSKYRNIVEKNQGGIVIVGEGNTFGIEITHNTLLDNVENGIDLDLGADGATPNDILDQDQGPNSLLNYGDYMQAFPLATGTGTQTRYWTWGVAKNSTRTEIYTSNEKGGGDIWVSDAQPEGNTFSIVWSPESEEPRYWLSSLTFDSQNNTSEFAPSIPVGADGDMDGILDQDETSSSPDNTDSDGDGLPDSVEDFNRNGKWDPDLGETSAAAADSDNDGVNDWAETHGDGRYDPQIDSNPLKSDTDGDGLSDGQEDKNGNGIYELYLGETHPLLEDSDGDHFLDGQDNCPNLFNPSQSPTFCQ